jgi:hypothetical protein
MPMSKEPALNAAHSAFKVWFDHGQRHRLAELHQAR